MNFKKRWFNVKVNLFAATALRVHTSHQLHELWMLYETYLNNKKKSLRYYEKFSEKEEKPKLKLESSRQRPNRPLFATIRPPTEQFDWKLRSSVKATIHRYRGLLRCKSIRKSNCSIKMRKITSGLLQNSKRHSGTNCEMFSVHGCQLRGGHYLPENICAHCALAVLLSAINRW